VDLLDRAALLEQVAKDPAEIAPWQRNQMDKALDIAAWMDHEHPVLSLG